MVSLGLCQKARRHHPIVVASALDIEYLGHSTIVLSLGYRTHEVSALSTLVDESTIHFIGVLLGVIVVSHSTVYPPSVFLKNA